MISLVLNRPFHEFQNDILDSCGRFIFFVGFYFGKMWKILEKRLFFRADMAGWGNTTRADMAGLGSIGLNYEFYGTGTQSLWIGPYDCCEKIGISLPLHKNRLD